MADGKHPAEPTGAQTLPPDPPTHFRCRESRREVPRLRRSHGSAFRSPCLERRGRMKTGGPEGRAPEPPSQRRKTVGLGEVASCQAELRSQPGGGEAGVAKSGKQREGLSSKSLPTPRSWRRRQLGTTHACLASLTLPPGVPTPAPRRTSELVFWRAQLPSQSSTAWSLSSSS